jgi:Ser/Thr protein kinase RdoA (MazF antagonist)
VEAVVQHQRLVAALNASYGIEVVSLARIEAGNVTDNYVASDNAGRRWFVKVYRDARTLPAELEAIKLAMFARAGDIPVPAVHRTLDGELAAALTNESAVSLWDHIDDAVTAEGELRGARWSAVGTVLGRLHRRLAGHPAATPTKQPATRLRDLNQARTHFEWLIAQYQARAELNEFEAWALQALQHRRALLPAIAGMLEALPELTTQIVHGDLASPNLLLRGDEVAAIIDFQPPRPRFVSWEIARIACDPRTVMLGDEWRVRLPDLLTSYRGEYPSIGLDDLASTVAIGCAYTVSSSYPLAEPIRKHGEVDPTLQAYARARHDAALRMLAELDGTFDSAASSSSYEP